MSEPYLLPDYPYLLSIGLQNFQTIRDYVEIPFAPITLIYGPNSAGKSAIADALRFGSQFCNDWRKDSTLLDKLVAWGNKRRHDSPISGSFFNNPCDVVLSYRFKLTPYILARWLHDIGGDGNMRRLSLPEDSGNCFESNIKYFLSLDNESEKDDRFHQELRDEIEIKLCFDNIKGGLNNQWIYAGGIPIVHWSDISCRINLAHPRAYFFGSKEGTFTSRLKEYLEIRYKLSSEGGWLVIEYLGPSKGNYHLDIVLV